MLEFQLPAYSSSKRSLGIEGGPSTWSNSSTLLSIEHTNEHWRDKASWPTVRRNLGLKKIPTEEGAQLEFMRCGHC